MRDENRVAIYIRVSTEDQAREGYSLSAQRRTLEAWAAERRYAVFEVYSDEGISGKDIAHRPAMRKLLSDIKRNHLRAVVVWALSRLTRSVQDLYNTWSLLEAQNISLISYTEAFDTSTPTGRAMMGLLGVFAQMEREVTGERVRAAAIERAVQGKRTCHCVLGYDLDGADNLKVNESEADQVRYIFSRYLEYGNMSAVAELCGLRGYLGKRGGVCKAYQIKLILSHPIYIGYNSYCGKLYKGMHEPIIDEKTFEKVHNMLTKRKRLV